MEHHPFALKGFWLPAVGVLLVAVDLTHLALKTPIERGGWRRQDLNDYSLNLLQSRQVEAMETFPPGFTYPPPSVLFRLAIGGLGFHLGGGLWIAIELVSAAAVFVLSLRLSQETTPSKRIAAAVVAWGVLRYAFEFEFKYLNCNLLFLALALIGWQFVRTERPALAGLFLAASIALKLYSVIFIPWLFFRRRWSVAAWAVVFTFAFFALLPAAAWGPAKAWRIHKAWLQSVSATSAPDFPETFQAYLVSMHSLVLASIQIWTERPSYAEALTATRIGHLAWAAFACVALMRIRSESIAVAFLLVAPLPLSPQLQPHHLIVAIPAATLLAACLFDGGERSVRRGLIGFSLAACFILLQYSPPRPIKGLGVLGAILVLATALWVEDERRFVVPEGDGLHSPPAR